MADALQDRFEFDEPDFAMIDTLFSLAEAHLFMQLVELQDTQPELLPPGKTRPDLYRCITEFFPRSRTQAGNGTLQSDEYGAICCTLSKICPASWQNLPRPVQVHHWVLSVATYISRQAMACQPTIR